MIACPSCATELPEASRFCLSCGARLAAPAAAAEERKVVTTLFCDLVGFTAMSEAADPEDVDALLREYHAAARKVIESHGGTVEKFIGDAVVGVFGVPAAHEDDPERAVRAGLRIVEALEGMTRPDGTPLEVRVGVNTGEALVRLDVDPRLRRGLPHRRRRERRRRACRPPRRPAASPSARSTHELTEPRHRLRGAAAGRRQGQGASRSRRGSPSGPWRAPVCAPAGSTTTPFLGREDELASLQSALREASRARTRPRSSSSSASPASARAVSCSSSRAPSTRARRWSRGDRGAACPTARGSRSGLSARSSRRTPASSTPTMSRPSRRSSRRCCPRARTGRGCASACVRCSASRRRRPPARRTSPPGRASSS